MDSPPTIIQDTEKHWPCHEMQAPGDRPPLRRLSPVRRKAQNPIPSGH